jgi:hypothetical protein
MAIRWDLRIGTCAYGFFGVCCEGSNFLKLDLFSSFRSDPKTGMPILLGFVFHIQLNRKAIEDQAEKSRDRKARLVQMKKHAMEY